MVPDPGGGRRVGCALRLPPVGNTELKSRHALGWVGLAFVVHLSPGTSGLWHGITGVSEGVLDVIVNR